MQCWSLGCNKYLYKCLGSSPGMAILLFSVGFKAADGSVLTVFITYKMFQTLKVLGLLIFIQSLLPCCTLVLLNKTRTVYVTSFITVFLQMHYWEKPINSTIQQDNITTLTLNYTSPNLALNCFHMHGIPDT